MNIILFEDAGWVDLLPLTWLHAAFELRCGRDRLIDKVRRHLPGRLCDIWLADRSGAPPASWAGAGGQTLIRPGPADAPLARVVRERNSLQQPQPAQPWCLVNARLLLTQDVAPPPVGQGWTVGGSLAMFCLPPEAAGSPADAQEGPEELRAHALRAIERALSSGALHPAPAGQQLVRYPWELIHANQAELRRQLTEGGQHLGVIREGVHLLNPSAVHVGQGAVVKPGVVLDAEEGPVHIDPDALIEPNAVIQGPAYIGPGTIVRPGAAIRPGTSLGPCCRVGGEIEASIFQGYANKQHGGFLGHSYVGEWVNLGADTVTSDLKNTYGTIRVWLNGRPVESNQRLVGSILGDHSKTAIGTLLPTGCVVGVCANVLARGSIPQFIPSFSWVTDAAQVPPSADAEPSPPIAQPASPAGPRGAIAPGIRIAPFRIDKAVEIARVVMARRGVTLTEATQHLLEATAAAARQVESAGWP